MKLGKAFSDNLVIQRSSQSTLQNETRSWWKGSGRALLFSTIVCLAFFVLVIRLAYLTIIRGHEMRLLADGNRIRELTRRAQRGILFDRTGKPLTINIQQTRVVSQNPSFVEVDYVRQYPYGSMLAHMVGYTGEVSEKELTEEYYSIRQYEAGDWIGRSGAEEVFEEKLRGRNGKELVEVDAGENILRTLGQQPEVPGENVTLSVDIELSRTGEQSFPAGAKGAIVVSKPSTGEILTLYSSPSFDPERMTNLLLNHPDGPLLDRAISGLYPPGSTFKIVTAIGALEENAVDGDTVIEDSGTITVGPFSFSNWLFTKHGKTDGLVDMVKAIQRSNDIFFYRTGQRLGITKLADWAHRVGIGKPLGIELSGEAGGLMPDPTWKNGHFTSPADLKERNNQWYLGDTYHVAIGQGYLLVTPLQVNAWTNVIANGGKLCKPTIGKVQSSKFKVQSECKDLGIDKKTIALITEGMRKACEPGGTGWPLFNFQITNPNDQTKKSIPVACKTGTAEFGHPDDKTHAWFTAFAPLPKSSSGQRIQGDPLEKSSRQDIITGEPEISVTVLVEGAGEGSSVAAPIAKKILEAWFSR